MMELDTPTRFQLEVSGDQLTPEILSFWNRPRKTAFSLRSESVHQSAYLDAVSRRTDLDRLAENVRYLKEKTTVRCCWI